MVEREEEKREWLARMLENEDVSKAPDLLQWDDLNFSYFKALVELKGRKVPRKAEKWIFSRESSNGEVPEEDFPGDLVFPASVAPENLLKELPLVQYSDILKRKAEYAEVARECHLLFSPMQAGTGSSMERADYLEALQIHRPLGAKGTDLHVSIRFEGKKYFVSLAEIQIIKCYQRARQGIFKKILFHDLVGTETEKAVDEIWRRPSLIDPQISYYQMFDKCREVGWSGKTLQGTFPNFSSEGKISLNRRGPGGHALFAMDALLRVYRDQRKPGAKGPLVGVLGNGEDLGCMPDASMVGWMIREKIPLVMVTTEKTEIDLKGGQISLVKNREKNLVHLKIIEQAEASEKGSLEQFQKTGLAPGERKGIFNTNMALFNYQELGPKLKFILEERGEDALLELAAPNLIENWKEQRDGDGVSRKYLQLEGAMGSVLLNLDKYWRENFGTPLVYFLNLSKEQRTRFFSPVKISFDFFMLFHSDRFTFDQNLLELKNNRPGYLPAVDLADPYYKEVQRVLQAFQGTSILYLDGLTIRGKVWMGGTQLMGNVRITNEGEGIVDLSGHPALEGLVREGVLVLENVHVRIDKNQMVSYEKIPG